MSQAPYETDSQNVVRLRLRRRKLEANKFRSRSGRLFNNFELYKDFYKVLDEFAIEIKQVKGHKPLLEKNQIAAQATTPQIRPITSAKFFIFDFLDKNQL